MYDIEVLILMRDTCLCRYFAAHTLYTWFATVSTFNAFRRPNHYKYAVVENLLGIKKKKRED